MGETTIGGNSYMHAKVNQWTNGVVESCLASLTKLQKPFKYIVTCVIMQKNGAGLHTASSCYWDNSTDGRLLDSVDHFPTGKCSLDHFPARLLPEYRACNEVLDSGHGLKI